MRNVIVGDSLAAIRNMADASVDSIVTDPPYGLSFMGKKWDYDVPATELWAECLRVLKPGGYLLSFAGTRTHHRMAVRIEDAGFEIRDMIAWVYGSGFPKSMDVSKAIDKAGGDGAGWKGWGTALKPALEPIVVARKPLIGTVAANVLAHGTGGLNIDGCRVGAEVTTTIRNGGSGKHGRYGRDERVFKRENPPGRWPANLIHDGSDEVLARFPAAGGGFGKRGGREGATVGEFGMGATMEVVGYGDAGSAARFFYCAKASKRERGEGNNHPTVKPIELMRYLLRLVTPPGGTAMDPFLGSGTTAVAAVLEGFHCIGIEMDPDYARIAQDRITAAKPRKGVTCA